MTPIAYVALQAPQDASPMDSWVSVAWSRFLTIRVSILHMLPKLYASPTMDTTLRAKIGKSSILPGQSE
jgi:hypothetical protein